MEPGGLERALKLRGESGERLAGLLAKLGLVSERDLAEAIAGERDLSVIGLRDT